jgi:glycerol-3-phosphate acyltransferase PlsY
VLINILAVVIGYLIGAIPSAYLFTRLTTGKDIRQLGSGNVGALNTSRQIGSKAGIIVFIIDMCKGIGVLAIAKWVLGVSDLFVLITIVAAVIGHNWSVFLKFGGGRGMATSLGAIAVYMFINGYWIELVTFLAGLGIALMVTRKNYALAVIIAMITVPVSALIMKDPWQYTLISTIILLLVIMKVLPIARAAWARSGNIRDFVRGN